MKKDEDKIAVKLQKLSLSAPQRIKLQNAIKNEKRRAGESTYMPGECAKDPGIRSGSVSFVLSVIIINTRFQLVHATF